MAQWVKRHFISIDTLIPAPTENKWGKRTKSTLNLWKKEAIEILKERKNTNTVSERGKRRCCIKSSQGVNYGRVLQVEESHTWLCFCFLQAPSAAFQGSAVISSSISTSLFIQRSFDSQNARSCSGAPAWFSQTGLHRFLPHPAVSLVENENGQKSFNELLMI